ncbi:methyltransferase family protein [Rhodopirellula sp. JC639]|uniref:methyltransferase family protein n=1 Tax=Stieleria mannarensis TaxID=2755585 RepID=UPI0016012E6C|nr:isoprenylcysteine carboxylmethyltransferase family protein [Rhodopirellula sp. JC639]
MLLWFLVFAQFLLAAALVLSARWSPLPVVALAAAAPGIVLAVWAWVKVGWNKIRIHPSATDDTQLLTDGPYAIVRHPMYTGLLWFTAALLLTPFQWWRLASWGALLLVLSTKANHEEVSMQDRFEKYPAYRRRVGRLLPRCQRHTKCPSIMD